MHTEGTLAPETDAEAREAFEGAGPTARTVVREAARAMDFDREEYRNRVTSDVVETARDALFASRLRVLVGSREEFEAWREERSEYEVVEVGNPTVDNVVWHPAPFLGRVVAATFQNEADAAVETLRRQAFGRLYRPLFESSDANRSDGEGGPSDTATTGQTDEPDTATTSQTDEPDTAAPDEGDDTGDGT